MIKTIESDDYNLLLRDTIETESSFDNRSLSISQNDWCVPVEILDKQFVSENSNLHTGEQAMKNLPLRISTQNLQRNFAKDKFKEIQTFL